MTEAWKQLESQVVNGEFPLLQYLGGSDHSVVFLTQFGEQEPQKVAIKLITADPDNAELQLARWELAAKLSHPHLIRLFRIGRWQLAHRALLYIVMEYAQEDLSQILPQRPLTLEESQDTLVPILEVLADVHSKGFVHGHIRPANIMAVDDQLKISSDGLSRIGESRGILAKPSVYDPPEAESAGMLPAGDVWALGVTMVETLTQRLPVWQEIGQEEPVLPETLPEPFLDIARHCLRRDPQRRWTVADIKARLQPTLPVHHEPATARPSRPFTKWRYIVPTAVALALLAILAGPKLFKRPPEPPRAPFSGPEKPETKTPTGGLVQGAVIYQVVPDVSQRARETIQGTVRVTVRVAIDPSGNVTRAAFDSPGPSKYFADLALQAARRWKFRPTKIDSQNVSSEWILRFQFERTGTRVVPVQASP